MPLKKNYIYSFNKTTTTFCACVCSAYTTYTYPIWTKQTGLFDSHTGLYWIYFYFVFNSNTVEKELKQRFMHSSTATTTNKKRAKKCKTKFRLPSNSNILRLGVYIFTKYEDKTMHCNHPLRKCNASQMEFNTSTAQ